MVQIFGMKMCTVACSVSQEGHVTGVYAIVLGGRKIELFRPNASLLNVTLHTRLEDGGQE